MLIFNYVYMGGMHLSELGHKKTMSDPRKLVFWWL